jgi:hypothetical protein
LHSPVKNEHTCSISKYLVIDYYSRIMYILSYNVNYKHLGKEILTHDGH